MYELLLIYVVQKDIISILYSILWSDSFWQQQISVNALCHTALCSTQYQEQYPDKQFCKMLHVSSFQKLYTVICYTLIPYGMRLYTKSPIFLQVSSITLFFRISIHDVKARIVRITGSIKR